MSDSFEYIQKMVKFAEGIIGLAQDHGVMPKKPGRKAAPTSETKVVKRKRKVKVITPSNQVGKKAMENTQASAAINGADAQEENADG